MRIGMSIRISEELYEATKLMAELYSKNYVKSVKHSNLCEKLVVKGIPFYIEDLKQREAKQPDEDIRHKLDEINDLLEMNRTVGTLKNKVFTFVTEKRLHMAIQEIAEQESRYFVTTTYNAVVGESLRYGLNFHIELLEGRIPEDKLERLIEIKKYVNGLTDKVGKKYKYMEEDIEENFGELYNSFSRKKLKKDIEKTKKEMQRTDR